MMKKGVVVAVVLMFLGLATLPTLTITAQENIDSSAIEVELLGFPEKKSYTCDVSTSELAELRQMLSTQTQRLQHATTHESFEIIKDTMATLETYGILENKDMTRLVNIYKKYEMTAETQNAQHTKSNESLIDNLFAFLILYSGFIAKDICPLQLIGASLCYLGLYFWMAHQMFIVAMLLEILGAPFFVLPFIRMLFPLKIWSILYTETDTYSWSIGLKGYQYSEFPYGLLIGFKGVKIIIPPMSECYCIGHTLAIIPGGQNTVS